MTNKQFDLLRLLQLLIPDIVSLYCILDKTFGWGHITLVEACVPIVLSIIGHVAKALSDNYFSTKTIIPKITPDKEPKSEV